MTGRGNAMWIGAFVVGAVALAIGALLILGSGRLLSDHLEYELYFDGSLKGLNEGAPVTYRGVRVGTVTAITVHVDPQAGRPRIPVRIELDSRRIQGSDEDLSPRERRERIDELVQRGLRAQLVLQSFVTGQLLVNLELFPDAPLELRGPQDLEVAELPTIPSDTEELRQTAKDVVAWVQDLPLQQIFDELLKTVESIGALADEARALVGSGEVRSALESLDATLAELEQVADQAEQLLANVDREIAPLAGEIDATLGEARRTLESATSAMESLEHVMENGSPLRYEVSETLREVRDAARSMRALTDSLEQNPESLVFGKGDAP